MQENTQCKERIASIANNVIGDFVTQLQQFDSASQCGEHLIDFYEKRGACATNIWCGDDIDGKVAGNYPEQWRKHIYKMGWATTHHVHLLSKQTTQPIFWGIHITPNDPRKNDHSIRVVESAYESFGATTAVTFPVHAFEGELDGGISFTTDANKKDFLRMMEDELPILHATALLTHIKIQQLLKTQLACGPDFSPRERECVTWLAKGLRTKQIADKLGLKEVTIYLYIQNARHKLQAKTREQLVAKAIFNQHISL